MVLRAVFLDVGNTLVTERSSRAELYARAARSRGVAVDEARMAELMRRVHDALPREIGGAWRYSDRWFERYIERVFHGELAMERALVPSIAEELFACFSRADSFVLHPGAVELCERLRARGLAVGLVSNWSARLPELVRALGLAAHVDFVLSSAIERLEKPDPALFARAVARAGVAPHEALHAGDHLRRDVLGARHAGLHAVLVEHAAPREPRAPRAPRAIGASQRRKLGFAPRVTSLAELGELVDRLCA